MVIKPSIASNFSFIVVDGEVRIHYFDEETHNEIDEGIDLELLGEVIDIAKNYKLMKSLS